VNKYQQAAAKAVLTAAEQKTVWKDHFVKQVNLAELVLIISVRAIHLTENEVTSIAKFNEAEFNDSALLKLLTKLNVSFDKYEPDRAVMTYLHQHSRTLNFELDFKNPKEHFNERETRSTERKPRPQASSTKKRKQEDRYKVPNEHKHKNPKEKDAGTASTVHPKYQCKRPDCIQRGTNTNHTHDQCKFKDRVSGKRYPNIGKAPLKRTKQTNQKAPNRSGAPVVPQKICSIRCKNTIPSICRHTYVLHLQRCGAYSHNLPTKAGQ
jgi:hypothetical protein